MDKPTVGSTDLIIVGSSRLTSPYRLWTCILREITLAFNQPKQLMVGFSPFHLFIILFSLSNFCCKAKICIKLMREVSTLSPWYFCLYPTSIMQNWTSRPILHLFLKKSWNFMPSSLTKSRLLLTLEIMEKKVFFKKNKKKRHQIWKVVIKLTLKSSTQIAREE